MSHPFLKEPSLSEHYVSESFPDANYTAPWHPVSKQVTNWIIDHTEPVTYNFNSHGFREVEWDNNLLNNSIWCFGDSQTAGVGNHKEQTWVYQLELKTGVKTLNMGIAGSSNDTAARTLVSALQHAKPKAICWLLAAPNRREIIRTEGRLTMWPMILKFIDLALGKKLFRQYMDSVDAIGDRVNYDKNLMLVKSICESHAIPLFTADFTVPVMPLIKTNPALDNEHLGAELQKQIADFFAPTVKEVL